ncbi:MAG: nicotinate-nucleotide adenylyltransferase [Planctomyces sp.]|nr:nicotinate-nucleotide adenylyltransferase [Planctomyces sp.]
MRIGIYGGTFDPVHVGHLLLAEQCREACRLDEVWFVPTGSPPHKQGVEIASGKARREMLELAIAGLPQFRVSTLELDRPGPHYTVETLSNLRRSRPDDELFLLMGGDSVAEFSTWREPERINELATIVAVNRGRGGLDLEPLRRALGTDATRGVRLVTMPGIAISASDLRRRVGEGRSIRFQTPRSVEQYILQHGLYRDAGASGPR